MNEDITLLTCNYNTPNLVLNLLKSVLMTSENAPPAIVMDTGSEIPMKSLEGNPVKYFQTWGLTHGEAVNLAFRKIQTRYVLLVDSDVIFLKDFSKPFEKFKESSCALMGKVVGNCGGKELYERVEPWYCFIDLHQLKTHKIEFFDRERTRLSKAYGGKIYDVGSTMFEDITKAGLKIADVNLEGKYFKHYGGMSWRMQSYDPMNGDTDIDFGGTHPHQILFDIGLKTKMEYEEETKHLESINIMDVFSDENVLR